MAKIVDPDFLNQGTEVIINPAAKTIQLVVAGNLDDNSPGASSGVTGRALYSFLKEEWVADATLNKYRFPIQMIYEAQFIWINGWAPADQQTRDLIRDAGFLEQTTGRQNACIISLGSMDDSAADLAYYQQVAGYSATATNFDKTGELNENVMIHDGSTTDYTGYFKAFLREQGKIYASYNLLKEQGLSALTYQAYRLPLSNSIDLNISATDATIDSTAPYTGMSIKYLKGQGFTTYATATAYPAESVVFDTASGNWYFTPTGGTSNGANVASDTGITDWEVYEGQINIGGTNFAFNRIIDGNSGSRFQIYEWGQRQLRKTTDINTGTVTNPNQGGFGVVNGNVAAELFDFVGQTLVTRPGVYITNFDINDQNSLEFYDITVDGGGLDSEFLPVTSTKRTYPFVSAGNMNFSPNLYNQPAATTRYTMYYRYITQVTDNTIAITNVTGSTADITWSGTILDHIVTGDYITLSGATNADNDGIWLVNSTGAGTLNATKQDGVAPVAETAGASITVEENPFETDGAIIVTDNSGSNIDGQITAASIAFDYDYDNNNQGGRTPGTDAEVVVVALAYDGAQYITVNHTITRATGQSINVSPVDELNYNNPT